MSLEPTLLIASPQMRDDNFQCTVVLVYVHNERGAMGVVINRPIEETLPDVVEWNRSFDLSPYRDVPVIWGGPCSGSGIVVTTGQISAGEGWSLPGGLGITTSPDTLIRLLKNREQLMLCLGYAGWDAGQLDHEIEQGGWLWTDLDPAIVFDTPAEERYDLALASLGLTRSTVWMQPVQE